MANKKPKPAIKFTEQVEHNLNEQAIISYSLTHCDDFEKLKKTFEPDDFQDKTSAFIFEVILQFFNNNQKWVWQHIADAISQIKDRPDTLELPKFYMAELVSTYSGDDVKFNVEQLLNVKIRNRMYSGLEIIRQELINPSKSLVNITSDLRRLEDESKLSEFITSEDILTQGSLGTYLEKSIVESKDIPFIGTGFPIIDDKLSWAFALTHTSIICGRPSTGKSTFRKEIQRYLSKSGIGNLCINRDQSNQQELLRILSAEFQIPLSSLIKMHEWTDSFKEDVYNRLVELESWPIRTILPIGSYYLSDIRRSVNDCRRDGIDVKVVFIDLFAQLDDVNVTHNKAQVISAKLIDIDNLATELNVHMCLLVQIRRMGDAGKKGEIDILEYLKESGGYEERAQLIFHISRPSYNNPDLEDNSMTVTIAKQKDGARFKTSLFFDPNCLRLEDDIG